MSRRADIIGQILGWGSVAGMCACGVIWWLKGYPTHAYAAACVAILISVTNNLCDAARSKR